MWKRRGIALILALMMAAALIVPAAASFHDVNPSDWYYEPVTYMAKRALVKGTGDHWFSPDYTLTRGMILTILGRMVGAAQDCPDAGFADVPEDAYYAYAVNWARQVRLIDGEPGEYYYPEYAMPRQELCRLLYRFARYMAIPMPEADTAPFTDWEEIFPKDRTAVAVCYAAGLISGYPDGTFRPGGALSRAEACAMLSRMGKKLEATGWQVGLDPVDPDDWQLTLVNPWNPVPNGYVAGLTLWHAQDGELVDARIYDDLMDMLRAMRSDGLSPFLNSAYRTNAYQAMLFNNKVSQMQSYGYSYYDARALAAQWVAVPGTSEHELGLAIDFNMYMSDSYAVHSWLQNYGWYYGFIHRYPEGKTYITGIQPESWHFRYVGREYAAYIHASGLTLEEFLAQYQ